MPLSDNSPMAFLTSQALLEKMSVWQLYILSTLQIENDKLTRKLEKLTQYIASEQKGKTPLQVF